MSKELSAEYYVNLRKAENKIQKVILKWFMEDPMMLEAHSLFQKVPNKNQKTIGINTKSKPPVITYNPNFINMVSAERLECVMAMEGFKILLKHPTTRLCQPRNIASLSSSITITPYSLGNILRRNDMEDFYPTPEQFGLKEKQCFEEYFRKLMDKQDETNEKIKEIWDSMSDEEKQQAIDNAQQQMSQGEEEQGEEEQGDGEDGDGFAKFDNTNDAMKEYFNPNGTSNQDWGENSLLESDIQTLVTDNLGNSKKWGTVSGEMFDEIKSAHTPKINYKEVLRRFNTSVMSMRTYSSRMKPNRRYGFEQCGQRREYDTKIIFAIDISGSMSDDDLAEGFAVINSLCGRAEIIYILHDTKIKKIERNFKKAKQSFEINGRGGTDFQDVVDYADKQKVDGLIFFTDGQAEEPTKPKRAKTLWLLHTKDHSWIKPPCDWGRVAYLERYQ